MQWQVNQDCILHNYSRKYSRKDCVVIVLLYPP
nr:MAG TPA: hypothetical protein [Bacteriophage sp.]